MFPRICETALAVLIPFVTAINMSMRVGIWHSLSVKTKSFEWTSRRACCYLSAT